METLTSNFSKASSWAADSKSAPSQSVNDESSSMRSAGQASIVTSRSSPWTPSVERASGMAAAKLEKDSNPLSRMGNVVQKAAGQAIRSSVEALSGKISKNSLMTKKGSLLDAGISSATKTASKSSLMGSQVSPSAVAGYQPDRNGIYTVPSNKPGEPPRYYAQVDGKLCEVTDFNPQTCTWRVMDPATGAKGPELERDAKGQWQPRTSQGQSAPPATKGPEADTDARRQAPLPSTQQAPRQPSQQSPQRSSQGASQQPSQQVPQQSGQPSQQRTGMQPQNESPTQPSPATQSSTGEKSQYEEVPDGKQKLMQACDMAAQKLEKALSKLNQSWDAATTQKMISQYGTKAVTAEGRAEIRKVLEATLHGVEHTKATGGANLHIQNFARDLPGGDAGSACAASIGNGALAFSSGYVRDTNVQGLADLMTHELSHAFAGTKDNWYLDGHGNHMPTYLPGGTMKNVAPATHTFDNALNNADSVQDAVKTLAGEA